MNRTITRLFLVLLAGSAVAASPARAQSLLFDYVGFDYEHPDLNPAVFGDIGDVYQGIGEVPVLLAPLVSDQTTYEYTYHFDGLTALSRTPVGSFIIITYDPGTITIYEDLRVGGTAFDYGTNPPNGTAPPSFVDGTPILVGQLTNFRYVFNTDTNSGSFDADFEVTGGTQLGNFPLNNRTGWTFAGTTGNSTTIPDGYDNQVDGQTFLHPPTATHTQSWGGLKAKYRTAR